jgi:hypothetical protein
MSPKRQTPEQRRPGRPSKPIDERLVRIDVRVSPNVLDRIDAAINPDLGDDRASVLRRLILQGLEVEAKRSR